MDCLWCSREAAESAHLTILVLDAPTALGQEEGGLASAIAGLPSLPDDARASLDALVKAVRADDSLVLLINKQVGQSLRARATAAEALLLGRRCLPFFRSEHLD